MVEMRAMRAESFTAYGGLKNITRWLAQRT